MADESILKLILKIVKQGSTKEAQTEMQSLEQTVRRAALGLVSAKGAGEDAAGALKTFGINVAAINNPLTMLAGGIKSSIDYTLQWADDVDRLGRATGTTARETSLLATVLGDFEIGTQQVEAAAKKLKDSGLTPNLETLKKLSAEYRAIQDPAERTRWGTEKLGKAYFDLAEVLDKTPEQWDAVTAAALRSGKVMGEDGVEAAQNLKLQMKQLNDQLDGVKIAVGGPLVAGLTKAIDAGRTLGQIVQLNTIRYQEQMGAIDHNTAVMRAMVVAGTDMTTVAEGLNYGYGALDESTRAAGRAQEALNTAQIAGATTTNALLTPVGQLDAGLKTLTNTLIYQLASQNMDAEAALSLGRSLGVVDDKSVIAARKIGEYQQQLADGKITQQEYINLVHQLGADLGAIPDKTITVTTRFVEDRGGGQASRTSAGAGDNVNRATGGSVFAGVPVSINESALTRPETFVPDGPGTILTRQQSAGLGGVNIAAGAIVINGAGQNAAQIADAVLVALARKARALAAGGAAYMGA